MPAGGPGAYRGIYSEVPERPQAYDLHEQFKQTFHGASHRPGCCGLQNGRDSNDVRFDLHPSRHPNSPFESKSWGVVPRTPYSLFRVSHFLVDEANLILAVSGHV